MSTNKYFSQLVNKIESRWSIDSSEMSMLEWVSANTTLHGRPFSTKGYEFQDAILNDMHPNLACTKCSQVGLTEIQARKALAFLTRNAHTSLLFTLPNEDMQKRLSKTRVQPLVAKDKVFNPDTGEKPARSMDLMQIDHSFLYIVPAIEASATSIPADVIFNDEVDLSDQAILALFNSRLQNSDWKITQQFSTPTFPLYGIDLIYQSSDQHHYYVRCDSCGHRQHPEFSLEHITIPGLPSYVDDIFDINEDIYEELDVSQAYVHCTKCQRALDLKDPTLREWVPKYKNKINTRGYRVSPFSTSKLDPGYILGQMIRYKKREFIRGFYNTTLGLPYTDGSIQLTKTDIEAVISLWSEGIPIPPLADVWIGIDSGHTCYLTLGFTTASGNPIVSKFEAIPNTRLVSRIEQLMSEYPNLRGGCMDRHPESVLANDIFRLTNGLIVPTEYRGLKEFNLVFDSFGELSHAQVERTGFLDEVPRHIKKKLISLSGYGHNKEVIIEHLQNMVRQEEPDKPATWVKLNSQDHYFHSLAFMLAAPKIQQLVREKSKADFRSMASSEPVDMPAYSTGLIGFSKGNQVQKKFIETRVLN